MSQLIRNYSAFPTPIQIDAMWATVHIEPIDQWAPGTTTLAQKAKKTHTNGGIQLHKYRHLFDWFVKGERFEQMFFLKKVLRHSALKGYREDLQLREDKPRYKLIDFRQDIFMLPGRMAAILNYGGAYRRLLPQEAWTVACDFVRDEFQNRFRDVSYYVIRLKGADWFYHISWDYSTVLFDKKTNELIFIDITDTD
jgi:hypothetical protein